MQPQVTNTLNHQKAGRSQEGFSYGNFSEHVALLTSCFQTSDPQTCERISFCCSKPPCLWSFLQQPQETNTTQKLSCLRTFAPAVSSAWTNQSFQIIIWLSPSIPLTLGANVTFSARFPLTTLFKIATWDFSGSRADRNLPANAGDTGSIPGPARFHMPWSN